VTSTGRAVVDSSALMALLCDDGPTGHWTARRLDTVTLVAPHLVMPEVANVLRRQLSSGVLSAAEAAMAHRDLLELPLELWPYEATADRAWELRDNLTCYDASYVALAETLDLPLVTLDRRLARASGPRCTIETPPTSRGRP